MMLKNPFQGYSVKCMSYTVIYVKTWEADNILHVLES